MQSTENTPLADEVYEALDDAICATLGQFRDIGVGPERTAFRKALLRTLESEFRFWPRERTAASPLDEAQEDRS